MSAEQDYAAEQRKRALAYELHDELVAALREIVGQEHYRGFGDPASRAEYVDRIARAALAKADGK